MFSAEERKLFNLWVPRHDYPFPLDLATLAMLYRTSRVFVHAANDERRCRVAAYAWSTGLPVVAMDAVASLLPAELQRPPFWFDVKRDDGYADAILAALAISREATDFSPVRALMSETKTRPVFAERIKTLLAAGEPRASALTERDFSLERLDIRLGRHFEHRQTTNTLRLPLELFVDDLAAGRVDAAVADAMAEPDPERALEERLRTRYDEGVIERLARAQRFRSLRARAGRLARALGDQARRYLARR
jgi:hypothetical protein